MEYKISMRYWPKWLCATTRQVSNSIISIIISSTVHLSRLITWESNAHGIYVYICHLVTAFVFASRYWRRRSQLCRWFGIILSAAHLSLQEVTKTRRTKGQWQRSRLHQNTHSTLHLQSRKSAWANMSMAMTPFTWCGIPCRRSFVSISCPFDARIVPPSEAG